MVNFSADRQIVSQEIDHIVIYPFMESILTGVEIDNGGDMLKEYQKPVVYIKYDRGYL